MHDPHQVLPMHNQPTQKPIPSQMHSTNLYERMPPIEKTPKFAPNSAVIKSERSQLLRQLRSVERREELQNLQKEGQNMSEQLTDVAQKYQNDMDEIQDQIQTLRGTLSSLENQRNKEVVVMEQKLKNIGKKIHELEIEEVSSPELMPM